MATIPDSVKAQLDADWSAAGGAEPTYYVEEDFRVNPPAGQDAVWIMSSTLDTDPMPVNDTFVNEKHVLEMVVNTLTSEDRLKELGDEVVRILNATAITDITYQRLKRRKITSGVDKGVFNYQEVITYDLQEQMKSSAAAYGAGAGTGYVDDLLMWGSANAAWVTPSYIAHNTEAAIGHYSSRITCSNVGTNYLLFWLGLPTTKGSLKLYISGHRVGLFDADASDFVTAITIEGHIYTTRDILNTVNTNRDAPGLHTSTFAAVDCSSYNNITASLVVVVAVDKEIDITTFQLQCYYDT